MGDGRWRSLRLLRSRGIQSFPESFPETARGSHDSDGWGRSMASAPLAVR